jgi:hypothetical protein
MIRRFSAILQNCQNVILFQETIPLSTEALCKLSPIIGMRSKI